MGFSENLRNERKSRGLSAKAFSSAVNIPYTTYIGYEKGSFPNEENLLKIARYLNVSIDSLLDFEVNQKYKLIDFFKKFNCDVRDEGAGFLSMEITLPAMKQTANGQESIIIRVKYTIPEQNFYSFAQFVKSELGDSLGKKPLYLLSSLLQSLILENYGLFNFQSEIHPADEGTYSLPSKYEMRQANAEMMKKARKYSVPPPEIV